MKSIFDMGVNLLLCSPQTFEPYREELESRISKTIEEEKGVYYERMRHLILDGAKANFWSTGFM